MADILFWRGISLPLRVPHSTALAKPTPSSSIRTSTACNPMAAAAFFSATPPPAAYKHDSPFTYFSSAELHLGEISLECSRPGAAAAALWATQKLLPLSVGG